MTLPNNPEIVIVGAGAAGIGAGLALTRLGVSFVIMEAKDRIGGRAFTDTTSIGSPWDQGCHWFHDATRNPLRAIAERVGHPFLAQDEEWATQWYVDGRALTDAEQGAGGMAMGAAFAAVEEAGAAGHDVSLAEAAGDLAEPYGPFVKFVFEAIGSGPAEDSSAVDTARYDGGSSDFPVSGGYGRLIEQLGEGLPVRLGCAVEAVTSAPGGLAVMTSAGALRPRAVILTVSNPVLASGRIRLDPALPSGLQTVLDDLPCGDCEKIAVELTGAALSGVDHGRFLAQHRGDMFSLQVRPFGRPMALAFVAGETARRVQSLSANAAGTLLADVLVAVYGSDTRKSIGRTAVTGWSRDPDVLGAYSYAKAGRAAARPALLAADLAPLFLAGEAHHISWFSTAHGAHVSGVEAAHKAARFLGHAAPAADPLWLPTALTLPLAAAK